MALLVAGLAIEGLSITAAAAATVIIAVAVTIVIAVAATAVTVTAAIILAGHKIGAAAAINPDAASVIAPRPPRNASRVAALAHQPDAASRIGAAIVTPPVLRSAI
jgi:hypothetical protein